MHPECTGLWGRHKRVIYKRVQGVLNKLKSLETSGAQPQQLIFILFHVLIFVIMHAKDYNRSYLAVQEYIYFFKW